MDSRLRLWLPVEGVAGKRRLGFARAAKRGKGKLPLPSVAGSPRARAAADNGNGPAPWGATGPRGDLQTYRRRHSFLSSLGLARKLPRNLRVSYGGRVGRSLGAASFAARCGRFRGTGLGGSLAGDLIQADCGVRFELNAWKLKTDSASSACSALVPLRAAGGFPWSVGGRVRNEPVADRRCPPKQEGRCTGEST